MATDKKVRLLAAATVAIVDALHALAAGDMPEFNRQLDIASSHLAEYNAGA